MSEVCLNLLTKINVPINFDPLDKIWSLEHWVNSLDRVRQIKCKDSSDIYQRFSLLFNADLSTPDLVEVERFRRENEIEVIHLVPPPGIKALSAKWWIEKEEKRVLFARRKLLIDESIYTPALAIKMFNLLRENIENLMRLNVCVTG